MGPAPTRLTVDLGAANSKGARTHQNVSMKAASVYFSGRGSQILFHSQSLFPSLPCSQVWTHDLVGLKSNTEVTYVLLPDLAHKTLS